MPHPFKDITGQRFGKQVAISPAGTKNRTMYWNCVCDCGRKRVVKGQALRRKRRPQQSCGCLNGTHLSPLRYGSRKKRPAWATSANLRRVILGPALRYLHVVVAYYQRRQNLAEISRATGIDKASLAAMLVKVRRAAGVRPELKGEVVQVGAMWRHGEEWFDGHVLRKDQRGARKQTHVPAMNNDTLLRKVILSHALRNLEIAERFWIRNQTIVQIAREMGLTYSTVSLRTLQVRRSMESPPERRYRERVYLSRP